MNGLEDLERLCRQVESDRQRYMLSSSILRKVVSQLKKELQCASLGEVRRRLRQRQQKSQKEGARFRRKLAKLLA